MDLKEVDFSLDSLISSFNARIADLQELVIARNMHPTTSMADLPAVDATLKAMESQIQAIKNRLQEEKNAIPKAKKLVDLSVRQHRKLQHMLAHIPSGMQESVAGLYDQNHYRLMPDEPTDDSLYEISGIKKEPAGLPKEKKVRSAAPRWYVTAAELDSLSSYMRGRLTLDKVNIAINEIATHGDLNFQLIAFAKKKLAEDAWEKALELREIAMSEAVKGKHFFLETDMKGPGLKLDNTGKAILTVLRHLGRIQETRIGHHRVIILMKPQ